MKHLRKYNEASETREKLDFSSVPKRELISGFLYGDNYVNHNGQVYEYVKKEQTYFDGEKGYVQYHIIIQRESDGKYFKGFGSDWGRGESEVDTKFEEVFKKEKITYYYE